MKMTPKYRHGRLKQPKLISKLWTLVLLHTLITQVLIRSKASSIPCLIMAMCLITLMWLKLLPMRTIFCGMACGTWKMSMAILTLQLVQQAKLVLSTTLWFPSVDFEQVSFCQCFFFLLFIVSPKWSKVLKTLKAGAVDRCKCWIGL